MNYGKRILYMLILITVLSLFTALPSDARQGGRGNRNKTFNSMRKNWDDRRDRWRNNMNNMQERWQDGWNSMRERQQDRRQQMRDDWNTMWDNMEQRGGRNR
jgi:hypothetical protein